MTASGGQTWLLRRRQRLYQDDALSEARGRLVVSAWLERGRLFRRSISQVSQESREIQGHHASHRQLDISSHCDCRLYSMHAIYDSYQDACAATRNFYHKVDSLSCIPGPATAGTWRVDSVRLLRRRFASLPVEPSCPRHQIAPEPNMASLPSRALGSGKVSVVVHIPAAGASRIARALSGFLRFSLDTGEGAEREGGEGMAGEPGKKEASVSQRLASEGPGEPRGEARTGTSQRVGESARNPLALAKGIAEGAPRREAIGTIPAKTSIQTEISALPGGDWARAGEGMHEGGRDGWPVGQGLRAVAGQGLRAMAGQGHAATYRPVSTGSLAVASAMTFPLGTRFSRSPTLLPAAPGAQRALAAPPVSNPALIPPPRPPPRPFLVSPPSPSFYPPPCPPSRAARPPPFRPSGFPAHGPSEATQTWATPSSTIGAAHLAQSLWHGYGHQPHAMRGHQPCGTHGAGEERGGESRVRGEGEGLDVPRQATVGTMGRRTGEVEELGRGENEEVEDLLEEWDMLEAAEGEAEKGEDVGYSRPIRETEAQKKARKAKRVTWAPEVDALEGIHELAVETRLRPEKKPYKKRRIHGDSYVTILEPHRDGPEIPSVARGWDGDEGMETAGEWAWMRGVMREKKRERNGGRNGMRKEGRDEGERRREEKERRKADVSGREKERVKDANEGDDGSVNLGMGDEKILCFLDAPPGLSARMLMVGVEHAIAWLDWLTRCQPPHPRTLVCLLQCGATSFSPFSQSCPSPPSPSLAAFGRSARSTRLLPILLQRAAWSVGAAVESPNRDILIVDTLPSEGTNGFIRFTTIKGAMDFQDKFHGSKVRVLLHSSHPPNTGPWLISYVFCCFCCFVC